MTDILTRLRDATPNDECLIMRDVINFACEKSWISNVERVQALRLVAVGAFVDAALTLIPEGRDYEITINGTADGETWTATSVRWWPDGRDGSPRKWQNRSGNKPTTALALCQAIFKARMAKEDDGGSTRAEVAEAVGFDDPYDHGQCNRADDPA